MLWPVVDHVAVLAERREVGVHVVRGVVISLGCGQHHPGPTDPSEDVGFCSDPDPAAPAITPPTRICVPPAAIAEMNRPSARAAARSPRSSLRGPNRITAESCGQSMG